MRQRREIKIQVHTKNEHKMMIVISRDIEGEKKRDDLEKKAVNANSLLPIIISGKLDSFQKAGNLCLAMQQ